MERDSSIAAVGALDVGTTPSCKLLGSLAPAGAPHVYVTSIGCCSLGRHVQLHEAVVQIPTSLGPQVPAAWQVGGPGLVLLRPSSRPRSSTPKESCSLYIMTGPCRQVLNTCSKSYLHHLPKPQTGSLSAIDIASPTGYAGFSGSQDTAAPTAA